ncbi:MAG: 30S ribosomal protein S6 [Marivivens sp.]
MKRKYDAMIVLDMKGKEETVEQLVSGLGREMELSGAKLEEIDHLGKRKFPYSPRHVESGYFVNFKIEADNDALDSMRAKFRLNENVYQQQYLRRGE